MLLYNIGIGAFTVGVGLAARFNPKARLWIKGRKRIFQRMAAAISPEDKVIWVHAASLGEFEQGRPIIEAIRAQHPEYKILLTFFSPSGYEIRKNYPGADHIFYLPADSPRNVHQFLKIAHPEIAIFVKYEFWLNYLNGLREIGCRTFIVSAIFRRNSIFFKPYGGMFRRALHTFERLFVQNQESQELLAGIGITAVTIAGDTRFDRVAAIAEKAQRLEIVERFAAGAKVFVAGSTWSPDEHLLARMIGHYPEIKFIIAPHEMDQARIDRFIAESPRPAVRYTQCTPQSDLEAAQVLIIDTIGILSSVYQYAHYGYIGGGFGVGIHNTLEAATFGLPIAFGPNYLKFKEACDLIEIGAATSISTFEELEQWLAALVADPSLYAATREKAAGYVASHKGATQKILSVLFSD